MGDGGRNSWYDPDTALSQIGLNNRMVFFMNHQHPGSLNGLSSRKFMLVNKVWVGMGYPKMVWLITCAAKNEPKRALLWFLDFDPDA